VLHEDLHGFMCYTVLCGWTFARGPSLSVSLSWRPEETMDMSEVCSLFVWEDNHSVGQSACLMSKWVPSKFTLEAAMSIATTDLILCAGPLDWLCPSW
jgi:hypothetical protein